MSSGPLRQLQAQLLRIIRWYLAPSGLLLAAALLVTAAALLLGQPWLGLVAVGLMAVFLPYRLSRQQGYAEDRLMEEVGRLRGGLGQSDEFAELQEIVRSWGAQLESISTIQSDFTKMRLVLTSRLNALDERVDEMADHGDIP